MRLSVTIITSFTRSEGESSIACDLDETVHGHFAPDDETLRNFVKISNPLIS